MERNQQVNIMDQVYRDAQYVRIWLGSPDKEIFRNLVVQGQYTMH
jgi:hypothetical protein